MNKKVTSYTINCRFGLCDYNRFAVCGINAIISCYNNKLKVIEYVGKNKPIKFDTFQSN